MKAIRILEILLIIILAVIFSSIVLAQIIGGNIENHQNVVNVNGRPMLKDTGQIFTINPFGTFTTIAVNTTCAIEWLMITNTDPSNSHYIEIADGNTVAAVTSGNKSAPIQIAPMNFLVGHGLTSAFDISLVEPTKITMPLTGSPLPIAKKLVIYMDSTTFLAVSGKTHKVGGK